MKRQCDCAGGCCGPEGDEPKDALNRREFLSLLSAGTATALLAPSAFALESPPDLAAWKQQLFEPGAPRVYRSDTHTDARMHLGGIGTGNFEIGVDGQFTTWQLFNTLRDGHVPFYFGVKAGDTARLLQTTGGPDWPRVPHIEMTGEYPFAHLRFLDPALPVKLELSAFSPFAPLDTRTSSMPLAAFVFKVTNPGSQPRSVSLAAFIQNPVGYDASEGKTGRARSEPGGDVARLLRSNARPDYGGNVNEPFLEGSGGGLFLRARAGREPALDQAVTIYATPELRLLKSPPPDRPPQLVVDWLPNLPSPGKLDDPAHTVLWLEEPSADMSFASLRPLHEAVQAGATLVFAGKEMPLLDAYGSWTGGRPVGERQPRPDIVFEDFERGFENWKVEGAAFGPAPARGALPDQQPVTGFLGAGFANSYHGGDSAQGRLTSKPFTIERNFIRFRIGGGGSGALQIRLLVAGKTVRAMTSAREEERLVSASWNVREFAGRTAQIEIVDQKQGPWGHINVDQIEFTDVPGERQVMELLEQLLPAHFRAARAVASADNVNTIEFENLSLRPGAEEETAANGLRLLTRRTGRGRVVLAAGPLLPPSQANDVRARQRAYETLCALVGAKFVPAEGTPANAPGFGSLAVLALNGGVTVEPAFENWEETWKKFSADGVFTRLGRAKANAPTPPGRTVGGAVAAAVDVPAGGSVELPFLLTWHYPNKYNDTKNEPEGVWMGCHYATWWPDARAVARAAAANFSELHRKTAKFRDAFYASTLPWWLLDCATANAAIIRHIGVVFRIANGDVYGWEGSNGCCPPTCTHVWGYEQTLAHLFPDLEREMRRIDFKHQQRADGGVNNRTAVPSPPHPTGEQPFADGHASCVLKAYREALNTPDEGYFKEYWPHIQRAVEYLIRRDAQSHDGRPAGYLEDDQWNTYDEALHGVTTFISGYYLAALRAGEEWARRVGDRTTAARFHEIFEKGSAKQIELCWNGEYFQQHLPDYLTRSGEVGPGCMSDQLIGQWWAHQLGLGYLFPKDKVVSALRAIFKYNWRPDLTGWKHSPRAFAGAGDKGLVICTWPRGGRPRHVMLYSDEVWTGIEYQVAAHMIQEGLVEEGFAIVRGARERYDGRPRAPIPRNPWNEIECGGHYARAMSSWSLITALAGCRYDGPAQTLAFAPRFRPDQFRTFFTTAAGWGAFAQEVEAGRQQARLELGGGTLALRTLELTVAAKQAADVAARIAGKAIPATLELKDQQARIHFAPLLQLQAGEKLELKLT
jgi:non-lysosomal glucosylceramidase